MTQEEFQAIDWHRGNQVRLTNGKEYPVKKICKRFLLLYTEEYNQFFIADYHIIDCRTSDAVDLTPKKSATKSKPVDKKVAAEEQKPVIPCTEAKPIVQKQKPASAVTANPVADAPAKKHRKRILSSPVKKVERVKF